MKILDHPLFWKPEISLTVKGNTSGTETSVSTHHLSPIYYNLFLIPYLSKTGPQSQWGSTPSSPSVAVLSLPHVPQEPGVETEEVPTDVEVEEVEVDKRLEEVEYV